MPDEFTRIGDYTDVNFTEECKTCKQYPEYCMLCDDFHCRCVLCQFGLDDEVVEKDDIIKFTAPNQTAGI